MKPSVRERSLVATLVVMACSDAAGAPAPDPPANQAECLERAEFVAPAAAAYCLPFPEGTGYTVMQSYCTRPPRSHSTRFAWDFAMPIGTEIRAARAGVVVELREHWPDDGAMGGQENMVSLRHDDQSISLYIHLQQNGVLVELGDTVPRGGLIALGGNSGTEIPHLHFMVCLRGGICSSPTEVTLPVSFRNAVGIFDARGGLMEGQRYVAGSCP